MTIQSAIGAFLRAYAGFTAIMGQRVYPVRPPDNPPVPYAYYRCGSLSQELPLDGPVPTEQFDLEITCASRSYDEAWAATRQLITALNYYAGTMGSVADVRIELDKADDQEAAAVGMFEVVSNFTVSYSS